MHSYGFVVGFLFLPFLDKVEFRGSFYVGIIEFYDGVIGCRIDVTCRFL